ncbi:carbohydrate ABC transporter permease [Paenibacillus sp. 1P07SE]|uniref:carbohydrate ABC transporter permease n=1 Tax=Paenibacillus sp. 1P07SE TaxID=3132209 RepID=UPI0039A56F1B
MVGKPIKQGMSDNLFMFINSTLLVILSLLFLYPLWFIVIASISDPNAVWNGNVWIMPVNASFDGYQRIFSNESIWTGYRNTILYAVLGTAINLLLTLTAAYPLSRKDFKARNTLMVIYVLSLFFSGGLIPTYLVVKNLGMINTIWAMIIPGAVSIWNVIVTRTFFQSTIPHELYEAATMDGCREFGFFTRMVLPLSTPIIAVMSLFYGVMHWNSFFNALIYLNNSELYPLQLFLREILIQAQISQDLVGVDPSMAAESQQVAETIKYGVIIVASLPVLIVYPFVQRFFVKGIMIGSLKG